MRADRLISLIMLLETKGPLTAKELAEELEVSQRTIYRDIESLSISGVPVYGATGPEGGYQLMEGYRSYLNGLNNDEVLALLSLNMAEHFDQLELGSKLKTAMLKLRSSYSHLATQEEELTNRLYIDPTSWRQNHEVGRLAGEVQSHFNIIHRAILKSQQLSITYNLPHYGRYSFQAMIEPLGVVMKENHWYLVYLSQEKFRVINISNILQITEIGELFVYPKDFLLKDFWEKWCVEVGEQYSLYRVKVLVPETLYPHIVNYVREGQLPSTPLPMSFAQEEWKECELYFQSFEDARSRLLIFGRAVKVVEPVALKYSILDFVEQIQNLYKYNCE